MGERTSRNMYYVDGSTVRKIEQAPQRERSPQHRPTPKAAPRTVTKKQISKKADRALAFNFNYTVFVVVSMMIMVAAFVAMLYMESVIDGQKNNINNLEATLETIENDNAAYKMTLDSMYTLEQIYDVASNELGMVYARKGQIVYYESADEDYVKQYQDVPEAN